MLISNKKTDLLEDLRNMIDQSKRSVALAVNMHPTALNWQMGLRNSSQESLLPMKHMLNGSILFPTSKIAELEKLLPVNIQH